MILLAFFYIITLLYVLIQDFNNKYIYSWSFYLMNIFGFVYYYSVFNYIIPSFILFLSISFLIGIDLYIMKKGDIKILGEDWVIKGTGLFDYYLYLTVLFFIGGHIFFNFGNFINIFYLFLLLILTFIIGIFLHFQHNKNMKMLLSKNEELKDFDKLIEDRKISFKEYFCVFKKNKLNLVLKTKYQKDYYNNLMQRVPLFIYGNTFLIMYVLFRELNIF